MFDTIDIAGMKTSAADLMKYGKASSWPDILTTEINGVLIRWQYANASGPCRKDVADRILLPFAHGMIPKGTALRMPAKTVRR